MTFFVLTSDKITRAFERLAAAHTGGVVTRLYKFMKEMNELEVKDLVALYNTLGLVGVGRESPQLQEFNELLRARMQTLSHNLAYERQRIGALSTVDENNLAELNQILALELIVPRRPQPSIIGRSSIEC